MERDVILAFLRWLWQETAVPVFLERYVLAVLGALTILISVTNPMNFDPTQRITGCLAILFVAYFIGHTIHSQRQVGQIDTSGLRHSREWLPLTPEQIAIWGNKMSPHHIADFQIFYSDSDSERLAKSLVGVGDQIKSCKTLILIDPPQSTGTFSVKKKYCSNTGITFLAPKDYVGAPILLDLLRSNGYQARWDSDIGVTTAVLIFIGEKP